MDRFIEVNRANGIRISVSLKSNMDRFIVTYSDLQKIQNLTFKIQYG